MAEKQARKSPFEGSLEDPEEIKVAFCALDSFLQAFYALPQAHSTMLAEPPFNYLKSLDKVDEAIENNADLARLIAKNGLQMYDLDEGTAGEEPSMPRQWAGCAKHQDVDKARCTLRQFYRDWSAEGAVERKACYGPVLRAIGAEREAKRLHGLHGPHGTPMKVLVPGAGLGRLVFELCLEGYEVEGNEFSYHQLLASSYVFNYCERAGLHTLHPWIHNFSNHLTREHHVRGYAVPDVHCATAISEAWSHGGGQGSMTMIAADFVCLYSSDEKANCYDAIASVFFLDTAPNLVRYLQTMLHCLKPGGILVNLGPLLWHFENKMAVAQDDEADGDTTGVADPGSFELSDDEVMALVAKLGFEIVARETGIEAPYIQDAESMLQTVYKASCWVARKPAGP